MEYKLIEILEECGCLPTKVKITMEDGGSRTYVATNENKSSILTNECFKKLQLLYEQEQDSYKSTMDFIANNPKVIKNISTISEKNDKNIPYNNQLESEVKTNKNKQIIKITSLSLAGILAILSAGYVITSLIKNNKDNIPLTPSMVTATPTKTPNLNTMETMSTTTAIPKVTMDPISQTIVVTPIIKSQAELNNQNQTINIENVSIQEANLIGKTVIKSQSKTVNINGKLYEYKTTTCIPIFDNEIEYMELPYIMILPGTGECEHAINGKNNHGVNVWNNAFKVSNPSAFSYCDYINEYGPSYPCIIEMIEILPNNFNLNNGGIELNDNNCQHLIYYLENLNNQVFTNGIGQSFVINPNINIAGHSSGSKCIGDLIEYIARQNLYGKNFNFDINKIVISGGGQYGKIFTTCDERIILSASEIFNNKIITIIGINDEYNIRNKGKHAKVYDFLYCNNMLDEETLKEYIDERFHNLSSNNINKECQSYIQKYSTNGEYILSLPINHDEGSNENALCILKIVEKQYQKSLDNFSKRANSR